LSGVAGVAPACALADAFAKASAQARSSAADLTEALEQQTATSEVLRVISSSPGDLQPVFDALLANATRLCEASYGAMWLREGDTLHIVALHGTLPEAYLEQWRAGTVSLLNSNIPMVRAIRSRQPVQVDDLRKEPAYLAGDPLPVAAVERAGIRTLVVVPMFRGQRPARYYRHLPTRGSAVHRKTNRPAHELRGPGRHRHRECAVAQRPAPEHH
jgi:hypothetical protein